MYVQTILLFLPPQMENCKSKYCGCLYYSSNALARIMTKMADEEFSVTGLTASYAFLLMSVNGKPGIHPKELSQHMQLTPSTVTRLVEKMEHRGYLKRKHVGRITEVFPTTLSKDLDPKIKEAWQNLYTRYSDLVGKVEGERLTDLINRANEKLE